MNRHLRNAAFFLVAALAAFPLFGQYTWQTAADVVEGVSGTLVGTVSDLDEAQRRLTLTPDSDRNGLVTVTTDSVTTQYNGFGDVINGKPEIFTGSKGFANLRVGDRLEIRGVGRSTGVVRADFVTLLGRPVAAPQTGVGETRSPSSGVSTPAIGTPTNVYGRVEGTVQQVNASEGRVVVETAGRQILTVRTSRNTPVYYQGETYQVGNLEVGDRVRVDADTSSSGDINARSIQVVQSVQDAGSGARVSTVSGRVTRIDRTSDVARVDTGRGEVRVDMSRANDANGRRVRAADLQVGDHVEISGSYGTSSDIFSATTVRFSEDVFGNAPGGAPAGGTAPQGYGVEPGLVTISGAVTDTLQDVGSLTIRERATGRLITLYVADDFVVRTKSGGYSTADRLNPNDNVMVKAYRDSDGNYIAQTIRIR